MAAAVVIAVTAVVVAMEAVEAVEAAEAAEAVMLAMGVAYCPSHHQGVQESMLTPAHNCFCRIHIGV